LIYLKLGLRGSFQKTRRVLSLGSVENLDQSQKSEIASSNVRFWPIADIPSCAAHVRFQGQSRHDICAAERLHRSGVAFDFAFGVKADMSLCAAHVALDFRSVPLGTGPFRPPLSPSGPF
jgi:hypothetical protein